VQIKSFNDLKKNLKKDFSSFPAIKISVLGDSSTQFLVQSIKATGYDVNLNFEIYEADYDQLEHEILDESSELYKTQSEFVIIFPSTQKLLQKFYETPPAEKKSFSEKTLEEIYSFTEVINKNSKSKIIYFNYPEINDSVFGNYGNKTDQSFIYHLRKINLGLMDLSRSIKNLYINDVCSLQNEYGIDFSFDSKIYVTADIVYSLDFTSIVAKNIVDIILSLTGRFKKCLILDLDNTLWGGIIGDDGAEGIEIGELGIGKAFTELQLWVKQLKERGIILAVCSKNDFETVKDAFDNHPDMVLRYDDFTVFIANWENKADNIKQIQGVLNIGFDSMVFLDDNPFERNMVREFLPEVCVPELPEDPAEYLTYLRRLNLFETSSFSEEDSGRTEQYKQESDRLQIKKSFVNEDEYLASLNMFSECKSFDSYSIPRVAQLTQRSNQFNLRTIRYTEDDIEKISNSKDFFTQSFTLEDKFGHNGLISLIIMQKKNDELFIDTWIMSCRVLKRTMENFVLNTIVDIARKNGFKKIAGEYIPTKKNKMVENHYRNFGFIQTDDLWKLDAASYDVRKTFISAKKLIAL